MSDWPLRDVRVNARRKKTRGGKKYIVIRGRWQICWICLDRSVLIVLTIIDRSFCRRRKKNACSPEHRSQSPPRDMHKARWKRVRDRRGTALLQDSKLASWIPFLCTFFSFVLYVCIYIYDIATHKYDSIVILSEFFVNDTETRKMSNEKELLIKTRRLYNIIMQWCSINYNNTLYVYNIVTVWHARTRRTHIIYNSIKISHRLCLWWRPPRHHTPHRDDERSRRMHMSRCNDNE